MITALVQFRLPKPISRERAKELFSGTAGGAYLWKSRAEAEKLYTGEWRQFILDTYGAEASVTYFESPVVVDNLSGEIIKD
jgi:hypothetical protein